MELVTLEKLRVIGTKSFPERPEMCPYCGGEDIIGIEVLGAYDGTLLWECRKCERRLLRFARKITLRHLDKTKDLYFDFDGPEEYYA